MATFRLKYVGVSLAINGTDYKIYNMYCPDNKDLSLHTMDIPNENCLVVGDFNSHSTSWVYKENNNRGDEIEDWQTKSNMILLNKVDDPPTYYSRRWMTTSTPNLAFEFATGDIACKTTREVST